METRIINSSLTEICAGGGNFLTQRRPTYFHTFFTRKILLDTESQEDYIEITSSQKTAMEKTDAAWERPPQSFIDQWNKASQSFGGFNEETGYFELNGLADITYEEAKIIALWGNRILEGGFDAITNSQKIRTNFPPVTHVREMNLSSLFDYQDKMEVCNLSNGQSWAYATHKPNTWLSGGFRGCRKLRKIIGPLDLRYYNAGENTFENCELLEDVQIYGLRHTLNLSACSKLSLPSLRYMADNAIGDTDSHAVSVHPDVYSKLTDEANTEWYQILLDAAEKNIQFATTI